MSDLFRKIAFRIHINAGVFAKIRQLWLKSLGLQIGRGTHLPCSTRINWPHQISFGKKCVIQDHISFDYCHGIARKGPSIVIGDRVFLGRNCEFNCRLSISVGQDCLIASGCKFVDHDHGLDIGMPMRNQDGPEAPIKLDEDVWLGVNVVILKGVHIGRGAVVAAGAVVTKSIPSYEIWGGVPARRLGHRSGRAI